MDMERLDIVINVISGQLELFYMKCYTKNTLLTMTASEYIEWKESKSTDHMAFMTS